MANDSQAASTGLCGLCDHPVDDHSPMRHPLLNMMPDRNKYRLRCSQCRK